MGISDIEWTHYTFNPWEGCQKISPGCDNCYAAERDARWHRGKHWGKDAPRYEHTDAYWRQPLKWDREAEAAGERRRMFVASLADVLEDRRDLDPLRERLWKLLAKLRWIDVMLLTKRPQNAPHLVPAEWMRDWPSHIWMGATFENQKYADARWKYLKQIPAPVLFASCEPLLGPLMLRHMLSPCSIYCDHGAEYPEGHRPERGLRLVIAGGESGHHARPMREEWVRSLRDQCAAAEVSFFFKQKLDERGRKVGLPLLDGRQWAEMP